MKLVVLAIVVTMQVHVAAAAKTLLEEFQAAEAAPGNGCSSIPYQSTRDDCGVKNKEKNAACKDESKKLTCKRDGDAAGAVNDIKAKDGEIAAQEKVIYKDNEDRTTGKHSEAELRQLEAKLKVDEEKLKTLQEQRDKLVDKLLVILRTRQSNGSECMKLREDVHDFFSSAKSQAAGETDPQIQPIAERLIKRWATGDKEHETEKATQDTRDKYCTWAIGNVGDYIAGKKP